MRNLFMTKQMNANNNQYLLENNHSLNVLNENQKNNNKTTKQSKQNKKSNNFEDKLAVKEKSLSLSFFLLKKSQCLFAALLNGCVAAVAYKLDSHLQKKMT